MKKHSGRGNAVLHDEFSHCRQKEHHKCEDIAIRAAGRKQIGAVCGLSQVGAECLWFSAPIAWVLA